ncbi:hypothetical protein JZX87_28260 [Agrobacterium sp. Ap1]|jgi:hypothetical protein|uniref:hypothetical protein n=1 Tax=Agrobacterium sp. Ap1 TaxID=2815337 RepID=UPI001A8C2816|nr:hypothetical protein [Agrobacterium sp. Ap1]MBO0145032.1 hypothetical protein [Agrobacterium sp. Ap1]
MIRIMDSHAYPGCPAIVDPEQEGSLVQVEFSDGTITSASAKRLRLGQMSLTIDAYRTRRGTAIAEKCWRLELQEGDRWRVVRRLHKRV